MAKTIFNCRNLAINSVNELEENGFRIQVYHAENDPISANRVKVSSDLVELELLPSKGFSLAQSWISGQAIFWEAPIALCDTENLDLWSDEIKINGNPAPGFTFLKTLVAGVELYGLKNWGMPVILDGQLHPLHGETSNIPVDEVQFSVENENTCTIESSFIYRSFIGDNNLPWYERGEALFKVTRKIVLTKASLGFSLEDTIENITDSKQTPDWGYHLTFRPEEGAMLIVRSIHAEERGGNPLPADIQTWHKAENEKIRSETGIIHKQVAVAETGLVKAQLIYTDGSILEVSTPPIPYFQTWFCNGGKGSSEFTDSKGESLLHKNWDGMGIEIGSSPLDHNGNVDKSVEYLHEIEPGEKKTIEIVLNLSSGICNK